MTDVFAIPELVDAAVILVKKREPYFQWARAVYGDDEGIDELEGDVQAYLVPEVDDMTQLVAKKHKWLQRVFNNELMMWSRDPDDWPEDRSWTTFKKWFEIELHTMVNDARVDMQ